MSELIKTPYEISLWGETLIWERRDLELVNIDKVKYKPGKFFSQSPSPNTFGEIPFTADCAVFNPTQRYYKLKTDGEVETSERPEELAPISSAKSKQYRVIWVGDEFAEDTAYFIRNTQTGAMELLDNTNAKPQAGTIYFIEQDDYPPYTINSYYKEYKHCVLGSNTMTSPTRAINGKLVSKISGENVLTFTLYHRYWNDYTGKMEINPLTAKLGNESKIKLRIGEGGEGGKQYKWYDLVIKQIQENSEQKTFTYTCKDQFVNELSKSGFEIELDNELENNMGTVEELAEYILEGSDWAVGAEKSNLMQYVEEPLYELTIAEGQSIQAINMLEDTNESFGEKKVIHVFYSQLVSQSPTLQFIYAETEKGFYADNDAIIDRDKHPNYSIDGVAYNQEGLPTWASHKNLCTNYRGMRLVRQARTKYDSTIGKYVSVYSKEGSNKEYYGFTQTEYLSPSAVINYMVNPTSFTNTTGWIGEKVGDGEVKVSITSYPSLSSFQEIKDIWQGNTAEDKEASTYLRIQGINSNYHRVMNSAIGGHRSVLKTITQGDRWILRLKCKIDDVTGPYATLDDEINKNISLQAIIANYEIDTEGSFIEDQKGPIFVFETFAPGESDPQPNDINEKGEVIQKQNYIYLQARATRSVSEKELKDYNRRFALCFEFFKGANCQSVYLEDVELFPYIEYTGQVLDDGGQKTPEQYFCVPNGALFSEARTDYYYYLPDATLKDYSELEPEEISQGRPSDKYTLKYPEGANAFLKIRSISGKESNRFNLIQDLCEKFECWARFEVKRKMDTGEILLGKDLEGEAAEGIDGLELYRQQKFITFSENMSETYNWAGFKYGINSKSITRSQDSAGIVSKMIVKNNANEFAQNGFCTISRATENPIKENFLLNFDHYYRQKLLDPDVVTNDLYETSSGYLGYYAQLREKNKRRDELINNLTSWGIDIAHKEATFQTYKASYDAAIEEKLYTEDYACDLTGYTFDDLLKKFWWYSWRPIPWTEDSTFVDGVVYYEYTPTGEMVRTTDTRPHENKTYFINKIYSQWEEDRTFIYQWAKYCQALSVIKQHGPIYRTAEAQLAKLKADYAEAEKQLKILTEEKRALNLRFYKKYARFLQEGSWIEESYTDDNLYYLDAQSTLHTSAQPKVSYTINVLDLSALPGYENYRFELGERTYVEDIEFFGYSKDGTPCKEEVVISEITRELDAPEKNVIKVQNYKTQFEDLFQRIAATTQSIEYHTGEYQRASGIVEEDGTITAESLDQAINKNSVVLNKAKDQSVVIDDNGITTTCISNPSKMVRIIDGGVFLSLDGGKTWRTGITAAGINTSILTAGRINTADIVITNKEHPSFRWNAQGINAFSTATWDGDNTSYNPAKFVRFDQYGIYGMNGTVYEQFNPDKPGADGKVGEDKIWKEAQYALTWKGFMLKRKGTDGGQVSISSDEDILVQTPKTTVDNEGNPTTILVKRIQIGDIGTKDEPNYGIRISDCNGSPVIATSDSGELWLQQALHVGAEAKGRSLVRIGYGDEEMATTVDETTGEVIQVGTGRHEVLRAGQGQKEFIVYDNGELKATGGKFTGEIHAIGGQIGNLTIDALEDATANLTIFNDKIMASVKNGSMEYKAGGLSIYGGGFDIWPAKPEFAEVNTSEITKPENGEVYYIKNDDDEFVQVPVKDTFEQNVTYYTASSDRNFYVDPDGKLYLTGQVTATSGAIGGFNIEGGRLTSSSVSIGGSHNIILDGTNGEIEASTIKLGSGAVITDQIVFKDKENNDAAYIYNPSEHDNVFIKAGSVQIKTDGTMQVGNIHFNGKSSTIQSQTESDSFAWKLTPDEAVFNNAVIQGTLESMVFKTGTTQTAGSAMIFMSSYKVKQTVTDTNNSAVVVTLEETPGGDELKNEGELVWAVKDNIYDLFEITSRNESVLTLKAKGERKGKNYVAIISLGKLDNNTTNQLIIGINGSNSLVAGHILPRGLTITEYGKNNSPNVYLGDLSCLNKDGVTGYGLYGDNVHLNGQLTTKTDEKSYAGINTISGVTSKAFYENYIKNDLPADTYLKTEDKSRQEGKVYYKLDNSKYVLTTEEFQSGETYYELATDDSKIVFWAGASSKEDADIAKAYFQVTEEGSVYAQRAKLADSLLVGGIIKGTDIYAARVHGWDNGKEGGLTFYDTKRGISFKSGYGAEEHETFSIGLDGLKASDNQFIAIDESQNVSFAGQEIKIKKKDNSGDALSMAFKNDGTPLLYHYISESQNCGFEFGKESLSYFIASKNNNEDAQIKRKMSLGANEIRFMGTIGFCADGETVNFQYKKASTGSGYDLYVLENTASGLS